MARTRNTGGGEPPLVGRADELEGLRSVLGAAAAGEGGALLVDGPAGIGKTRLLTAARDGAGELGMRLLGARGTELERDLPLGIVRQLFAPAVRNEGGRERLLQGAAGLAGPAILDAADPGDTPPAGLLHGLYWLVANLSDEGPLALVVDDAHWADEASQRFLAYLARRAQSLPVALVLGARPGEHTEAASPVSQLAEDPDVRHLELRALDAQGVEQLLRERHDDVDPDFALACQRATGGNPFLLEELVRELETASVPFQKSGVGRVSEVTPPSVARTVAADLARLGPETAGIVEAVSVLGDGTQLELAAGLASMAMPEATSAVAAAVRAGILDDHTDLRFRHPLLGSAAAAASTTHERAEAHARAAALLRARGAAPERIATQLLHSPPAGDPRTVADLREAARRAGERGAPATSATLLERALAEPPSGEVRAEILLALGAAELDTGATTGAAEHLDEAYRCASDPLLRARTLPLVAQANPTTAAVRRLCDLVEASLPEVEPLNEELAMRLRSILVLEERHQEPDGLRGDTVGEAVLLGHIVFSRMVPGAVASNVADIAERATRQTAALIEEGASTLAFTGAVLGLRWTDRLDGAVRLLDQAVESGRRRGSIIDYGAAMTLRATVHRQAGRLREAEADARAALDAQLPVRWSFARGVEPLVGSLVDQGRLDEAARELDDASLSGEVPDAPPMIPVVLTRMGLHAARREHDRARADWEDAVRRAGRLRGANAAWIEDLAVASGVHRALGDDQTARELVDQALGLAQDWDTPAARGIALHAQARLGDGDTVGRLREAAHLLAESPRRLEHARALVSLGAALRRRGDRVDSRDPLREGYDLARQCSAQGLAEVARGELRASGVRVRREALSGVDSLTPSELRIAEMAAVGLSNAEVAQELFLTVKTVEMHLTHAYRKLGVRGRPQLSEVLGPKDQGPGTGSAT